MSNQSRLTKVLAALLLSMTVGAVALMALGNNPPSAGAFCLASYYRLDPVAEALISQAPQTPDRWNSIEIYYSGTSAGNIEQLASLSGLPRPQDINCHFCLCNGFGGRDGLIQTAERWHRQWSIMPGRTWYGSGQTIRICVVGDSSEKRPTGCQIRRLETLVENLCRRFEILPDSVYYPGDWQ